MGSACFSVGLRELSPPWRAVVLLTARAIVAEVDELIRLAETSGTGEAGRLCVGVVSSIAGGTARELLGAFLAAHREIDLQVVEGSPRDHISEVRALKMDVTFVVGSAARVRSGCAASARWLCWRSAISWSCA